MSLLLRQAEWPRKHSILGVHVSATTYAAAVDAIIRAALAHESACVSALAVHGLVTGADDPGFRDLLNSFDLVSPDGQPVRLALNVLYDTNLGERVYGPELTLRLCARAAEEGVGVYFYGSHTQVVSALTRNLVNRFPGLIVAGEEPSLFRPLTAREDEELVHRIRASGAGLVFLGLGCPLQERFAYAHRDSLPAVQVCVGAAFDFLSGAKPMAPGWMQRWALEWLFRLSSEPRRLWRRYASTNWRFLWKLSLQLSGIRRYS